MPRLIGNDLHIPTTNANRMIRFTGTVPCIVCCRPAVGQMPDGHYYCDWHMREKYGFNVPVDAQYYRGGLKSMTTEMVIRA